MSATEKRSQKGFIAVTLITVLAITLVFVAYAAILGTISGGNVAIVAVAGSIGYSTTNTTGSFQSSLSNYPIGDPWYAQLNTSAGGYSGAVTIYWTLEKTPGTWTNVTTQQYSFTLDGTAQTIYASTSGAITGNYNWGQNTTTADTYRITVIIYTA